MSEWKQKVAGNFDACAHRYDHYGRIQNKIAQNLAATLPEFDKPDILEIGCGTGALTQYLLSAYKDGRFHVTDISPQMINHARARIGALDEVEWSVMDGENPASDRRYDLIIGNMAFQWFENADEALERLRGFLNPGGAVFYTVPAPACFKEWRSVLSEMSLSDGMLEFKTLPGVFKEEEMVESHKDTLHFLKSLKQLGASTPHEGYEKLSRRDLLKACRVADERFHAQMTWRILYGQLKGDSACPVK